MTDKPILVAGGTGRLGTQIVQLLMSCGFPVRVMTRDPARAAHFQGHLIEVVQGDVRDKHAVEQAVAGVRIIISAVHGFVGTNGSNPRTVDCQGNSNLIRAAQMNDVDHFILMSIQGAASDHPLELFRMKYLAEQELKASRLPWTIIRPTAYMETWAALIGEPLLKTGKTTIFGQGDNPINFVSVYDIARFVELAVTDPAMQGVTVEVGGPENPSMRQVVRTFETISGKHGKVNSVPLSVMRLMSVLMRLVKPAMASQIQAGVVMDTHEMSFDSTETSRRYPSIALTNWAGAVRRDYMLK